MAETQETEQTNKYKQMIKCDPLFFGEWENLKN